MDPADATGAVADRAIALAETGLVVGVLGIALIVFLLAVIAVRHL